MPLVRIARHGTDVAKTRRKNDGLFDDIANALLHMLRHSPWWTGPIVTLLAWAMFAYALPWFMDWREVEGPSASKLIATISRQAAWIAPAFVGVVWLIALSRKMVDRERLARQQSLDDVRALGWREFEQLLAEAYRQSGYEVTETVRGADGGVDLCNPRGVGTKKGRVPGGAPPSRPDLCLASRRVVLPKRAR